jgi:hypothetical protein
MIVGRLKERWYDLTINSAAALLAAYGFVGSRTFSSEASWTGAQRGTRRAMR